MVIRVRMKKGCVVFSAMMLVAMLTGCGDGSEEVSSQAGNAFGMPEAVSMGEVKTSVSSSNAGTESTEIELLYSTGNLTAEEEKAVQETMEALYQNLDVEEYLGESIHAVCGEPWVTTMAVRLYEGCRSYTLHFGEEILLSVQVGYDMEENFIPM